MLNQKLKFPKKGKWVSSCLPADDISDYLAYYGYRYRNKWLIDPIKVMDTVEELIAANQYRLDFFCKPYKDNKLLAYEVKRCCSIAPNANPKFASGGNGVMIMQPNTFGRLDGFVLVQIYGKDITQLEYSVFEQPGREAVEAFERTIETFVGIMAPWAIKEICLRYRAAVQEVCSSFNIDFVGETAEEEIYETEDYELCRISTDSDVITLSDIMGGILK